MTFDHKQAQLDELLATSVDGAASPELFAEIEQLLLDDPALQRYYAQWMSLQVQLQVEYSLLGYEVPAVTTTTGQLALLAQQPFDTEDCHSLVRRIASDVGSRSRHELFHHWGAWSTVAALLLLTAGGAWYNFFTVDNRSQVATARGTAEVSAPSPATVAGDSAAAGAGAESQVTLKGFSQALKDVNPVSWPGLQLASFVYRTTPAAPPQQGPLELDDFFKQNSRGYVMVLDPGCRLDLIVDAYAEGKNQLVLLELGPDGTPNGRMFAFNNKQPDEAATANDRMGRLGRWSDFNASSTPRYYLLAGFHMLHTGAEKGQWRLSRFSVGHQSKNLLQVGWDDSFIETPSDQETSDQPTSDQKTPATDKAARPVAESYPIADSDFDDLIATARITNLYGASEKPQQVVLTPAATGAGSLQAGAQEYPLTVKPGEMVLIRCGSSTVAANMLSVVDAESREVVWTFRSDLGHPAADVSRLLGIAMIENFSQETKKYVLVGQNVPLNPGPNLWHRSKLKIKSELDDFVQIGMEDGGDRDFNDILVDIEWSFR